MKKTGEPEGGICKAFHPGMNEVRSKKRINAEGGI
jgi:hypothetical protein